MTRTVGRMRWSGAAAAIGIAATAIVPPAAAADPHIEVTRRSETAFQLAVKVDAAIDPREGQKLLAPAAAEACGGRPPTFGSYRFSQMQTPGKPDQDESFVLIQDIECSAELEERRPASRALDDSDRAAIKRVAQDRTDAYLRSLDGEDYASSHAMLLDSAASAPPLAHWQVEQREFKAKAGSLRSVDVWRATMYVDPPNAAHPGIYVATDFEALYENLLMCGYLVWLEDRNRELRILRRDVGYLEHAEVSDMTESELAAIKSDFGCRGNAP